MKYRIVKKYDRYGDKDEIKPRFHLEVFSRKFFQMSPQWNPVTDMCCGWGECFEYNVVYSEEADAKEHYKNLLKEIPEDQVIIQSK